METGWCILPHQVALSYAHPLLMDQDLQSPLPPTATLKSHCKSRGGSYVSFYSHPFFLFLPFFLLHILSDMFMLSYCHITIDNNTQNGHTAAFHCNQIVHIYIHIYMQTLIIQCFFTLICPKRSINKNQGYLHLQGWVITPPRVIPSVTGKCWVKKKKKPEIYHKDIRNICQKYIRNICQKYVRNISEKCQTSPCFCTS